MNKKGAGYLWPKDDLNGAQIQAHLKSALEHTAKLGLPQSLTSRYNVNQNLDESLLCCFVHLPGHSII